MQCPACLYMVILKYNVAIAATRCGCDDVLIEGKGNEEDENQKINNRANSAHGFRSTSSQLSISPRSATNA